MTTGAAPALTPTRVEETEYPFRFSVCTLVTRRDQYARMLETFRAAGFSPDRCEFLYVDNTERNSHDAFQAFNLFLRKARGRYVIVCHQDVELIHDDLAALEARIAEVEALDPMWALLGNAGGINLKHLSMWISMGEPPRFYRAGRAFPQRVQSLDENFIVVKSAANLAVSADLAGFHFYGTDVCLVAELLGFHAYVIAFHLYHRSEGTVDDVFHRSLRDFRRKYRRALGARYVRTTIARLYLPTSRLGDLLFGNPLAHRLVRRYHALKLRLTGRY